VIEMAIATVAVLVALVLVAIAGATVLNQLESIKRNTAARLAVARQSFELSRLVAQAWALQMREARAVKQTVGNIVGASMSASEFDQQVDAVLTAAGQARQDSTAKH
jgi:hypothetical protein